MALLEFIVGLLDILNLLIDLVRGTFNFFVWLVATPDRRRAKREQKLIRQIEARVSNNDKPISS